MRHIVLSSLAVVAACLAVGLAIDGLPKGPNASKPKYWVELDNAFGLIQGGDLKIAGVRAGKITDLELDRRSLKAKVGFQVLQSGFGDLRADTTCESRPQSLIGEYFLDCNPGTAPRRLRNGAVIPVSRTSSTIPPDLVNNILRKPQRERLSILISELGAGVAGNGANLNDAIRRAVPALRETDRVLAILARQNKVITDLNVNADTILRRLAGNKRDVGRWVLRARDISRTSAQRAADITRGFQLLPGFLEQLKPTMAALGQASDAQAGALRNLDSSAKQLHRFFDDLGPFSDASRPATRALGKASVTGREAVVAAAPTVAELRAFASGAPELGKNLAMVLEHLDSRGNAVEMDARAARMQGVTGPSGFSGLEALLQYVMNITTATNIYDQNVHLLNVAVFQGGKCAQYTDAATRKADPSLEQCAVGLGPNQPGINFVDSTSGVAPDTGPSAAANGSAKRPAVKGGALAMPSLSSVLPGAPAPAPATPSAPSGTSTPAPGLPSVPKVPAVPTPGVPLPRQSTPVSAKTADSVLSYLLGP
jgi:virulence factor Mce-like protein